MSDPLPTGSGAPTAIFDGLNAEQRRAVEAVRGPVCILAGAGSGKTTTITRRIAHQVVSGTFRATEILAVTFTVKAAEEMRRRLAALGAPGVPARTFHSAAFAQLSYFSGQRHDVLDSKIQLLLQVRDRLPQPFRTRAVGDLATEIEWAKNRRLTPATYLERLAARRPPLPAELMRDVFAEYERRKERAGQIDHEDQLELTIRLLEERLEALDEFRDRYRAFTVDEYQDVNLLQQTLLELWLGERDDVCVVGDDYQSIYGFTGAGPEYLLAAARRPGATVIRLETNYRSTPEILSLANRLAPKLGGVRKELRAVRPAGRSPVLRALGTRAGEAWFLPQAIAELRSRAVPLREIAVLYRVNYRSADYEEALELAGIPYQVREGGFLERAAARNVLPRLRRSTSTRVEEAVRGACSRAGLLAHPPDDVGPQETARQNDLRRLVALAAAFDDGERTVSEFVADLERRFAPADERDAVQLLTYHSAKGLEFEAVLMPRLEERELPYYRAIDEGNIAEERRLFYVGLTRAKNHLYLTWSKERPRSQFLDEIDPPRDEPARPKRPPKSPKRGERRRRRGREEKETGLKPRLKETSWRPF